MEDRGLKISRKKTDYLGLNGTDENRSVSLEGERLKSVNELKYLGSHVSSDRELDKEIIHRIKYGWINWRRTSGVLCDRRISARVKGKVYKTVVRPAIMYGAETWSIKKSQEKKLDAVEMKMLRWMCGVTKLDKIRSEIIRDTVKVREISSKIHPCKT